MRWGDARDTGSPPTAAARPRDERARGSATRRAPRPRAPEPAGAARARRRPRARAEPSSGVSVVRRAQHGAAACPNSIDKEAVLIGPFRGEGPLDPLHRGANWTIS